MAYADDYFQNQLNKSGDKVAWQYGTLVNFTGLGKPGLKVLDAGCGAAPGLRYLVSAGYDTYGTDLVTYPLDMARRLAPAARLSQSDLTAPFPYAANSFDLVLMAEVIEHFADTQALLRECLRVLTPGGAVVMETPNLWDVRRLWYGKRWPGNVDPTHKSLFNPRTLAQELRQAGYSRVRVQSGFKPMFWVSSRALKVRFGVPYPPLIGNTLIAAGFKGG